MYIPEETNLTRQRLCILTRCRMIRSQDWVRPFYCPSFCFVLVHKPQLVSMLFNTVLWAIIVRAFFSIYKTRCPGNSSCAGRGGGEEVNKIFPKIQIVNPRGGPGKGGGGQSNRKGFKFFLWIIHTCIVYLTIDLVYSERLTYLNKALIHVIGTSEKWRIFITMQVQKKISIFFKDE